LKQLTGTYAVHLEEPIDVVNERLIREFARVQTPMGIPIAFVAVDESKASRLTDIPGVLGARQASDRDRRIVYGLDHLLYFATAHWNATHTNGLAKGYDGELSVADIPPYPRLDYCSPGNVSFLADVQLSTRLCAFGAVNMSVQPVPPFPFCPSDPVSMATQIVSESYPVVIAAGNRLASSPNRLIRGWAEADWVISVGATLDEEGLTPAPYSLVGSDKVPGSGPTVMAFGGDDHSPRRGTSFAAPRVSEEIAVMAAYQLSLGHYISKLQNVEEGIPVVGLGFIDLHNLPGRGQEHGFCVADLAPPTRSLPALPIPTVREDSLEHAVEWINEHPGRGTASISTVLRRMLLASAWPMRGFAQHLVGYGFVSPSSTLEYLARFDAADFASVLLADGLPPAGLEELRGVPLFDIGDLPALIALWRDSVVKFAYDITDDEYSPEPLLVIGGEGRDLTLTNPEREWYGATVDGWAT
jgi:hypothetical protein